MPHIIGVHSTIALSNGLLRNISVVDPGLVLLFVIARIGTAALSFISGDESF